MTASFHVMTVFPKTELTRTYHPIPIATEYNAVKRSRHVVEDRYSAVFTGQKPLMHALHTESDHFSRREVRHPDHLSQFRIDLRYIKNESNCIADVLPLIQLNTVTSPFPDPFAMAAAQI